MQLSLISADEYSKNQWDGLLVRAGISSLQQSYEYGQFANARGAFLKRYVILRDGEVCGFFQVISRKILFLKINIILRAPLLMGDSSDAEKYEITKFLRKKLGCLRNFIIPEPAHLQKISCLKLKIRPTAVLDLRPDIEILRANLNQKWRNRLNKAERQTPRIKILYGRHQYLEDIFELEAEQRITNKYISLPPEFVDFYCCESSTKVMTVLCMAESKLSAAMIFLLHGVTATYHMGVNTPKGKEVNAHNLLMWRAITELKKNGIQYLDMSGLGYSTGIDHFKLGTGALKQPLFLTI